MNSIKFLFFFFLVTSLWSQNKNDWEKAKLKGEIASLICFKTTNIGVDENITHRTHINSGTQIFNKKGYLVQEGKFLDLEQVYMDQRYTYDSKNCLLENFSFWTKIGHKQNIKYTYKDNLIIEEVYKNNNYFAKYVSELDFNQNVVKKTSFNKSGIKIKTIFFEYKRGNIIKEKSINHLKNITSSKINIYDTKGGVINEKGFYKGNALYEILYKYNDKGDVVEEKRITGDDIAVMTYRYKYDNKNNYIEKIEVDVVNQMKRITKRKISYLQSYEN